MVMRQFILLFLGVLTTTFVSGQSMEKKYHTFEVKRVIPFSAEKVWKAVADDYGNIANSHPKIVASNYENGSLKGDKGAQRRCYFNEKQTRFLYEEIVDWKPEEMMFVNRVLEAGKFPINEDNTRAIYRVKKVGPNKAEFSMVMEFRTKPAFMGGMAKGQFKKLLNDYMIAVEHHIKTGESVTVSNFKQIKKGYL